MSCSIAPFPVCQQISQIVGVFNRHAGKDSAGYIRRQPGAYINDRPVVIALFNIKERSIYPITPSIFSGWRRRLSNSFFAIWALSFYLFH